MASRGKGRRGRPRGTGQAPPTFDQQAFAEAVGIAAAAIAQASAAGSQGGPSNLQRFRAQMLRHDRAEFYEMFMGKYFSATARHAKAQEFLELKQGAMTVIEYVARFTELARFADDYVAIDLAQGQEV